MHDGIGINMVVENPKLEENELVPILPDKARFIMASQTRLEVCSGSIQWDLLQQLLHLPAKDSSIST
jgi:hypothetical protein